MSHLIVPRENSFRLLDVLVNAFNGGVSCEVGLFQNDLTPDIDTGPGDVVDADFSGYGLLTANNWTGAFIFGDGAKSTSDLLQFEHDGGATDNDIYGYYVNLDGDLVWLERFDAAPVVMAAGSPPIIIIPAFTLRSLFLS